MNRTTKMTRLLKVAAAQLGPIQRTDDRQSVVKRLIDLLRNAHSLKAELVVFPELALTLRAQGANILTAPAAFTYTTGQMHWQLLLQARAIDSQCHVLGLPVLFIVQARPPVKTIKK